MLESDPMVTQEHLVEDLQTLNDISQILNQAVDVASALNRTLSKLVELMGLHTGWIFEIDPAAANRWDGRGYRLVAHHNLPPALARDNSEAWDKNCDCQALCTRNELTGAYNEVRCSRLGSVFGDREDLAVHASTPLRSGPKVLGILNVAAPDWTAFTPRNLSLLTNVGSQMGIAIERARLYDLLQDQRLHEQAALLELSQQLLGRRDLDDLMAFIVEEVRKQLSADACAILLTGPDPDFLYFRAAAGWSGDPVGKVYRAPADESTGSGIVLRTKSVLLIEDLQARVPPLWTSNWLDQENFRAAAFVPLIAAGRSIGTLVIDSREPRSFSESEVRFLQLMANQAALAIETARLHQEEIQRQRLEEELEVGRNIQMSMLPANPPQVPGWEFAAHFEAAHQVGGDFYDLFSLPGEEGRWAIVIGDVSDKGVPAALFMTLSRTTIRNVALRGRAPNEVIAWANRFIQEDSQSDMFLTAFYGELDTRSGWMNYVNAGHNPPLIWRNHEQDFISLTISCPLLGVLEDLEVNTTRVHLAEGDVMVLFTDGVTEAMTETYDEFGVDRLSNAVRACLSDNPASTANEIVSRITQEVRDHARGAVQNDDLTLLVIRHVGRLEGPALPETSEIGR